MHDAFDKYVDEYESWYEKYPFVYLSELEALKGLVPDSGDGLEIGIGTGRFAAALNIKTGVEPFQKMKEIAESRGVHIYHAVAENLPFSDKLFDFILMATTICFLDDTDKALQEIYRVLRPQGCLIVGFIDRDSFLGKVYEENKSKSKFYKDAGFYSANEVINILQHHKFSIITIKQTLFHPINDIISIEQPEDGYGRGGFVAVKAVKLS